MSPDPNKILEKSVTAVLPLTKTHITTSEPDYSRTRVDALCDEWRSRHPLLRSYLDILVSKPHVLTLNDFDEEALFDLAATVDELQREYADEIERLAGRVFDRNKQMQFEKLARELLCCLYKVGVIGIKVSKTERNWFSFENQPIISPTQIENNTKIVVTRMFIPALGIDCHLQEAA